MARPTLDDIVSDILLECGRGAASSFKERVERRVRAAYFEIAILYHHFGLDKHDDSSITFTTGENDVDLPVRIYQEINIGIVDPASSKWLGSLTKLGIHDIRKRYSETAAAEQPKYYARRGHKLIIPRPAEKAYKLSIDYYKEPDEPSFGSGPLSELDLAWDWIIHDRALVMCRDALFRPDLAAKAQERLNEWFQNNPQPLLRDVYGWGMATHDRRDVPHGGPQG